MKKETKKQKDLNSSSKILSQFIKQRYRIVSSVEKIYKVKIQNL